MIGSIRWNIGIGGICFLFTFIISFSNNLFSTAIVHSCISGLILFVIVFIFRWLLGIILITPAEGTSPIGNQFNYTTPEEGDAIHQLIRGDNEKASVPESFEPLDPPKLVSKRNLDPVEMTKAFRQMSED